MIASTPTSSFHNSPYAEQKAGWRGNVMLLSTATAIAGAVYCVASRMSYVAAALFGMQALFSLFGYEHMATLSKQTIGAIDKEINALKKQITTLNERPTQEEVDTLSEENRRLKLQVNQLKKRPKPSKLSRLRERLSGQDNTVYELGCKTEKAISAFEKRLSKLDRGPIDIRDTSTQCEAPNLQLPPEVATPIKAGDFVDEAKATQGTVQRVLSQLGALRRNIVDLRDRQNEETEQWKALNALIAPVDTLNASFTADVTDDESDTAEQVEFTPEQHAEIAKLLAPLESAPETWGRFENAGERIIKVLKALPEIMVWNKKLKDGTVSAVDFRTVVIGLLTADKEEVAAAAKKIMEKSNGTSRN